MPPATSSAMRSPRSSLGTGVGSSGMGLSLALARFLDDLEHLAGCALEVVVDHDEVVLRRVLHLSLRDLAPLCHLLLGIGARAQLLAPDELLLGRWCDEDEQAIRRALSHLF